MGDTSDRDLVFLWDSGKARWIQGKHKHSDVICGLGYGRSHVDCLRNHPDVVICTLDHGELMMCSNGLRKDLVREVVAWCSGRFDRVVYSYAVTDKPGSLDGDKVMGREEFLAWLG